MYVWRWKHMCVGYVFCANPKWFTHLTLSRTRVSMFRYYTRHKSWILSSIILPTFKRNPKRSSISYSIAIWIKRRGCFNYKMFCPKTIVKYINFFIYFFDSFCMLLIPQKWKKLHVKHQYTEYTYYSNTIS